MIYIFGATGYIGRYLCAHLSDAGVEFTALGRSDRIKREFFDRYGIPLHHFDFNDFDSCRKELSPEPGDCFVNLSACLAEHETPIEQFFQVNTAGTGKLLEWAKESGVRKYVMTSTHKVYNNVQGYEGKAISEEVPIRYHGDHTPYIISKVAAENLVSYYNEELGMNGICLRLTGVHGYGEILGQLNADGSYRKSSFELFFEKALKGEPIEVWGDQQIRRDHIYVKDVVSAILASCNAENAKGIYNVASGRAYSQYEEACVLAEVFADGRKSMVSIRPDKPGLTRGYLYDIGKIRREIGWSPVYSDLTMLYQDYRREWESKKFHNYHHIDPAERPLTF